MTQQRGKSLHVSYRMWTWVDVRVTNSGLPEKIAAAATCLSPIVTIRKSTEDVSVHATRVGTRIFSASSLDGKYGKPILCIAVPEANTFNEKCLTHAPER